MSWLISKYPSHLHCLQSLLQLLLGSHSAVHSTQSLLDLLQPGPDPLQGLSKGLALLTATQSLPGCLQQGLVLHLELTRLPDFCS